MAKHLFMIRNSSQHTHNKNEQNTPNVSYFQYAQWWMWLWGNISNHIQWQKVEELINLCQWAIQFGSNLHCLTVVLCSQSMLDIYVFLSYIWCKTWYFIFDNVHASSGSIPTPGIIETINNKFDSDQVYHYNGSAIKNGCHTNINTIAEASWKTL